MNRVRTAIFLLMVAGVLYGAHLLGIVYCPLRRMTGLPCPACGTVRATLAFLSGDFAGAFARQPLGLSAVLAGAAVGLAAVLCPRLAARGATVTRRWRLPLLVAGALVLLANWGYVLVLWR